MPIEAGDFKTGLTLLIDGNIYQVLDFQHVKPGKGAAILKTKLKDLKNGGILERNFNPNIKFDLAIVEKKAVQYSYAMDGVYCFMDLETYDMYELPEEVIGDSKNYLVENQEVSVKFFEGELLSVDIPEKVTLTVTETSGAVAGNTATNATKDATLETGITIKVPLFIKEGDKVVVSTADGKYNGRA